MNVQLITQSKTRLTASDEARYVKQSAQQYRARDPVPVIYRGKITALVGEDPRDGRPYVLPKKYHMAIDSYDHLIKAITVDGQYYSSFFTFNYNASPTANKWYDTWLVGGDPGVGALGTAATATPCSDQTFGAIQHGGNVSPKQKILLYCNSSQPDMISPQTGSLLFYDRVLAYDQCTVATGTTTLTNTLSAGRYISDGIGLQILATGQVLQTGSPALNTLTYTKISGGTTTALGLPQNIAVDRVINDVTPCNVLTGTQPFISLAGTDLGVSSAVSYVCSATDATALLGLALVKPVAIVPMQPFDMVDFVHGVPGMQRVLDGACLSLMFIVSIATIAPCGFGQLGFGWA